MDSKKTLVLGASENEERYSNRCMKKLKLFGHEVVALGLRAGEVDGIKIETEKIPFENVDTVTIYMGEKNQKRGSNLSWRKELKRQRRKRQRAYIDRASVPLYAADARRKPGPSDLVGREVREPRARGKHGLRSRSPRRHPALLALSQSQCGAGSGLHRGGTRLSQPARRGMVNEEGEMPASSRFSASI